MIENTAPIAAHIAEILEEAGDRQVVEFAFDDLELANLLGKDRWKGCAEDPWALGMAKRAGFRADLTKCVDSPGYRKAAVVGIGVLDTMAPEDAETFLEKSQGTPHAVFAVKFWRGSLSDFLGRWWPHVDVHEHAGYLVAHCRKRARRADPVLTIGCSTLLDFTGVQWTLAALNTLIGYDRKGGLIELLVVDNHPEPTNAEEEREIEDMRSIVEGEGARYIRWAEKQGTYPGKNRLKVEAAAPWVLTMDSHVMLSPGTVETVLAHIEAHPESQDFHHFPNIGHRRRGPAAMDFRQMNMIYRKPEWKGGGAPCGFYGWTGNALEPGEPYPIAAMITSCYLVRKNAWHAVGGYDPILGNYGGWEGPLQMKWWLTGRRVVSLRHRQEFEGEALHHWHLFNNMDRLKNATGRVHTKWSKIRNFMASCAVIGGEPFAKWLCRRWKIKWEHAQVQEGFAAGMKLRPWMIENLAHPEWEDIFVFFQWMLDEEIPGALTEW